MRNRSRPNTILAIIMVISLLSAYCISASAETNIIPFDEDTPLQYINLLDPVIPFMGNNPGTGTQDGITVGAAENIDDVQGALTQRRAITGHPYIASIFGTRGYNNTFTSNTDYRSAFDGTTDLFFDGYPLGHIGVEFKEPQFVARIKFYPRATYGINRINGCVFEGSNDDVNWDYLCTISGLTLDNMDQWHTVDIADGLDASTAYKYFRLIDRGALSDMFNIAELQLWTADPDEPSADVLGTIHLPETIYPNASVDLPDKAGLGLDINWSSLTPEIMDNSGHFIWTGTSLPVTATLKATVEWDTETFTRDINIEIVKPGEEIFDTVDIPPMIYPSQIVDLPVKGDSDFDITWSSLTPDIMNNSGVVVWTGALPVTAKLRASVEWPAGTVAASRDFDIQIFEEITSFGFDTDVVEDMELLIELDFEDDPVGDFFIDTVNGSKARARSGSAAASTTAATLDWGSTPGPGSSRSAKLSQNFHLELTKEDDSPLLKGLDEFVVSYDVNPTGTSGNNVWTFVAKRTRVAQLLNFERQLSIREAQNTIEARSWYNSGSQPEPNSVQVPAGWRHVDVHFEKDKTTIYFNGIEESSTAAEFPPSYILQAAGGFTYVGYMATGQYFTGEIDNFKIWKPKDPDDAGKVAAAKAALNIPFNTTDNPVRGNISLPDKGIYDTDITWETSHPTIVDLEKHEQTGAYAGYDPKLPGVITRPTDEDTVVTMTATITSGTVSDTKEIQFTVKKALEHIPTADDFEAYLYTHFTGTENSPTDEQIYFAVSHDGVEWVDTRLRNDPALLSTIGDQGVRDPYIVRAPEGDKFYLIATDLNINRRGGWGSAGTGDSCINIAVWESTDLVNWGDMRLIPVAGGILGAGNAWAPECVYDELTGDYFVFWASQSAVTPGNRIHYTRTRDFYTFTEAKLLNTTFGIDVTIIKQGDIWFLTHAGTIPIYKSDDLRLTGNWTSLGDATTIIPDFTTNNGRVEGPEFLLYNKKDWHDPDKPLYGLFMDRFERSLGYVRMTTTDLASRSTDIWKDEGGINSDLTSSANLPPLNQRPSKRHGSVMSITKEEYLRVLAGTTRGADHSFVIPDDYNLIAAFGFNHMPDSGTDDFNDQTGNAKLVPGGNSKWDRSTERAPDEVGGFSVNFTSDNDSWLNLTKMDGSALLRDENGKIYREVIITYNSNAASDNEDDAWSFFASNNNSTQTANNERYIGISDKADSMTINRWNNDDASAPSLTSSLYQTADTWKGVVLYLGQTHTELYVNGMLAGWQEGHPTLEEILGADGGIIQIGKGNIGADGQFFQGQIDNLKIYALPLDAAQNQRPLPQSDEMFEVTVESAGADASGSGHYTQGTFVTIYAGTPPTGQRFTNWTVINGDATLADANNATTRFIVPANDVRVRANFEKTSSATNTGSGGGTGTIPGQGATGPSEPGDTTTGSQPPGESWFQDVNLGDWFYDNVRYVYQNGLMNGTSTSPMLFDPNGTLTRGMIVTILYRQAGSPSVSGLENPFSDVPGGQWYTDGVIWAADKGVVEGFGDGLYGPERNVTREQLAAILFRYAQFLGKVPGNSLEGALSFADAASIADYAKDAALFCSNNGIITGKPGNLFDPQGNATRAEAAAMLNRFIESILMTGADETVDATLSEDEDEGVSGDEGDEGDAGDSGDEGDEGGEEQPEE